ncbi:4a-hydroxytetrahydrobiopterin dehydratase [Foetidibacter luteolus]|uniref:4a-hydroxytetrahydrobiopterin dehydratase n=1 Tax=Foetidibacter luteolus TaxID=2608880 RepID=UPI00129BD21B|nr:4a-hydroxytetrahydrobiopterin dehydratase [Foetidibacter luteolus]
MKKPFTLFISYRRNDTGAVALLLKQEIESRLKFVRVIIDVEEMRLGQPFPAQLKEAIENAYATIVLIGKNWMPANSSPVQDWVVEELKYSRLPFTDAVVSSLQNDGISLAERHIIPVCVDCDMTAVSNLALPEDARFITERETAVIRYSNWPREIGPLVERIAGILKLEKRQETRYPAPDRTKARTQPVADEELAKTLGYQDYDGWYIDNYGSADKQYLVREFEFAGFDKAAEFINIVSAYCSVLNHHPDWRNVYGTVFVSLTTWDARNRITIYDLNLALYMNKVADMLKNR